MDGRDDFLAEHLKLTRRWFLGAGAAWAAAGLAPAARAAGPPAPALARALEKLEPYFTPQAQFQDVSRGNPVPHSLPEDKKRAVGLTGDTWSLEVISDPEYPATLGKQLTRKDGTALDFAGLLRLAEKHAVRFPKVMTCLNIGCPLDMAAGRACRCARCSGSPSPARTSAASTTTATTTTTPSRCSAAPSPSAGCSKTSMTCRPSSSATS